MFLKVLACIAIGYLLGSVISAVVLSKLLYHEDVRSFGSGNSGATNAARAYGVFVGLGTFLGDFLKGILACWLGSLILGGTGLAIAGAACIVGHSFPVFFGFKGGKGVATGAALALMLDWRIFVIGISLFLIIALITGRVSAGSIAGCLVIAIGSIVFVKEPVMVILGVLSALFIIASHYENIKRLLNGTEKKFKFGKPKPTGRVK